MDEIIGRILFGFFWIFLFISYYGREIIFIISIALSIIVIAMICNAYKVKNAYKLSIIVFVISCISVIYLKQLYDEKVKKQIAETKKQEEQAKRDIARAIFDEQCQKAGEQIYRTVDNVDGVMLLRVLGENKTKGYGEDPMWEEAALASIYMYTNTEDYYIKSFLNYITSTHYLNGKYQHDYTEYYWVNKGYQYVDVLNKDNPYNDDNYIIRYTRTEPQPYSDLNVEYHPVNPARYAITYENNVDPELRKHWVAGVTIKIIDLQTNELMAEKKAFTIDPGRGYPTTSSGTPWERADTCQEKGVTKRTGTGHHIHVSDFAIKVLKPKQLVFENTTPENPQQGIVQEQ